MAADTMHIVSAAAPPYNGHRAGTDDSRCNLMLLQVILLTQFAIKLLIRFV